MAIPVPQDKKREAMIFMCHKDEMRMAANEANEEEMKPVVVFNCNAGMGMVDLKIRSDQKMSEIMLENAQCSSGYVLVTASNKNIDAQKFRLPLPQGLMEKHGSGDAGLVLGHPTTESPPKRLRMMFPRVYSCHQKEG
jgi:hypothetical protein